MQTWFKTNWLALLSIVALVGAWFPFPYVYFQLLDWIVLGAAGITAYRAYRLGNEWVMWLFILVGVVFNPLAPLHLREIDWLVADAVAAVLFAVSFFLLNGKKTIVR